MSADDIFLLVVGWAVAGVLAYGYTLGLFLGRFPHVWHPEQTYRLARHNALAGPIGLVVVLLCTSAIKYQIRFRRQTRAEYELACHHWEVTAPSRADRGG